MPAQDCVAVRVGSGAAYVELSIQQTGLITLRSHTCLDARECTGLPALLRLAQAIEYQVEVVGFCGVTFSVSWRSSGGYCKRQRLKGASLLRGLRPSVLAEAKPLDMFYKDL